MDTKVISGIYCVAAAKILTSCLKYNIYFDAEPFCWFWAFIQYKVNVYAHMCINNWTGDFHFQFLILQDRSNSY